MFNKGTLLLHHQHRPPLFPSAVKAPFKAPDSLVVVSCCDWMSSFIWETIYFNPVFSYSNLDN